MSEFNDLEIRNFQKLNDSFVNANNIVSKKYLEILSDLEIENLDSDLEDLNINKFSRFFKLNKLVYSKEENSLDKLSNILNAILLANASLSIIIKSDGTKVSYYLGVINKNVNNDLTSQYETMRGTFEGHFTGSDIRMLKDPEMVNLTNSIFNENEENIISVASSIASLNLEKSSEIEKYIQGLEKLTDSMKGKVYTLMLIADPVLDIQLSSIRAEYENLYSDIVPFLKTELSFNESDTLTLSEGITEGFTDTINKSITNTQNISESKGWNFTENKSEAKTKNLGGLAQQALGIGAGALLLAAPAIPLVIGGAAVLGGLGVLANGLLGSKTNTSGTAIGENGNITTGKATASQEGIAHAEMIQNNKNTATATTSGKSIQISSENRSVKSLLEKIDKQIERVEKCEDFGCFNFAAYFISNDASVNNMATSTYNALMKGENSSVESSAINTWEDKFESLKLKKYLKKFMHPIFRYNITENDYINVSGASIISGKELAIHLMLPKKSINGLPVVESTSFGRNIFKLSKNNSLGNIKIGKIYHMGQVDNTEILLDKKSLAMHTFITGSTGAGKSNTIYKMIEEFDKNRIKFLVIEPAKGEYKNVFGHRKDVSVFGTNNKYTKLLRINPFKFSDGIHVLEHIDRLIEIFNASWPMYAAMPAVLKEAIERAYELSGWDLETSENEYNENLFPTFEDVLLSLSEIINNSAFSEELKGNYIGALVTRVKSLTNGLNRQIFVSDEVDNNILFDSNVIVDLSRIGSIETKSMIMGILIMRLQEHRLMQGGMNNELKHITILEEAHNILKRTSTEQSGEGSNLLGKSVEMLSNAIAEMRTYGEGFIIADQSPSMLDMSVIRNTNTKIILRLPEQSDRELVGKAIALTDNQIIELAKLETGVAAIYQNDWLEPILCKVDNYKYDDKQFVEKQNLQASNKSLKIKLTELFISNYLEEKNIDNIDILTKEILNSNFASSLKINIVNLLNHLEKKELKDFSKIISDLYYNDNLLKKSKRAENFKEWNTIVLDTLDKGIISLSENHKNIVIQCLLREISLEQDEFKKFYFEWSDYMRGEVK